VTDPTHVPPELYQAATAATSLDAAIAGVLKTADIPADVGIVVPAAPITNIPNSAPEGILQTVGLATPVEDKPINLIVPDERPKAAFAISNDEAAATAASELARRRETELAARRIEEAHVPGSNILRQHVGDLKPTAEDTKETFEEKRQEHLDAQKQAFTDLIRKARQPERVIEYKAPPISERVAQQTKDELKAGREASQKIAATHAARPRPVTPTGMVPVLRPATIPKFGEGYGPDGKNLISSTPMTLR
jgi:hypothetical protein